MAIVRHAKIPSHDHDALAEDLALAKGGVPYLNVCLGSSWLHNGKTPRADVLICQPSYQNFLISIYEIKISRSDFLSDIRKGKWREYLPHSNLFYFATVEGICSLEDIPEEAGWIVRTGSGWRVKKQAPKRDVEVPRETLLSLVFARQRSGIRERHLHDVITSRNYHIIPDSIEQELEAKSYGRDLSYLIATASRFRGGSLKTAQQVLQDFLHVHPEENVFQKTADNPE